MIDNLVVTVGVDIEVNTFDRFGLLPKPAQSLLLDVLCRQHQGTDIVGSNVPASISMTSGRPSIGLLFVLACTIVLGRRDGSAGSVVLGKFNPTGAYWDDG